MVWVVIFFVLEKRQADAATGWVDVHGERLYWAEDVSAVCKVGRC